MITDVDTKNAAGPSKPRASRPVLSLALYVFLLVTLCFVAYEVRLCMARRSPAPPRRINNTGAADFRHSRQPPQSQSWDPARAGQSALAGTNLTPLDKDPSGLAPPPGAKAGLGFQEQLPGQLEQQRAYECPGDLDAVKAYYAKLLGREGFALNPAKAAGDSVELTFGKGVKYGILSLRKIPGQVKMVKVQLIVISVVTSE